MTRKAFGIVSLLDIESENRTRLLWRQMEDVLGRNGLTMAPNPHISFQVAEDYRIDAVMPVLKDLAKTLQPFPVQISGLGVFTGATPVLYLPVVRKPNLDAVHQKIWQTCGDCAINLNPYYTIERWMPHITLAFGGLEPIHISNLVEEMAFMELDCEILMQNFTIAYQIADESGVSLTIPFGQVTE